MVGYKEIVMQNFSNPTLGLGVVVRDVEGKHEASDQLLFLVCYFFRIMMRKVVEAI